MTRSPVFGALLAAALAGGVAGDASAFAFLNVVTTACTACPGGRALDVERSYHATPRWDASPSVGALRDGLQVTILGGIPAALGVTDPALAARMEAAMVAGVEAWSSPALAFDITLGAATPATEITIGIGFTPSVGGITDNVTSFSSTRMLTNGEVSAGPFLRRSWITMNEASLTTMFASIRAELALGALQRLVAHEMGHALGLGHPTDVYEYNVVVDASGALVVSADAVDDTAIMVPIRSQPGLSVAFDPAMRADDLTGRDVLYPTPEPSAVLLLGAFGAWLVRRARA